VDSFAWNPSVILRGHRRASTPLPVSFADVIAAHHAATDADSRRDYKDKLAAFCGRAMLDEVFWGRDGASGVAVTIHGPRFRRSARLHRVSDLATSKEPEIAGAIQNWDVLAVRAQTLRGPNAQVCMRWIFSAVSYLLGTVLAPSRRLDDAARKDIVARQAVALNAATEYYTENATRGAYLSYFWGMCSGALSNGCLAFGFVAFVHWGVPHLWGIHVSNHGQAFALGAVVAGGMGTILSVLLRMTRGGFRVSYEIGWWRLFILGSFRPFIGAATGLATYFALRADLISIQKTRTFALVVFLAFLSGFSERFARDTFLGIANTVTPGSGETASGATTPATGTPPTATP
jgi:hypothetical protein